MWRVGWRWDEHAEQRRRSDKTAKWRWLALLSGLVVVLASVSYVVSYQTFIQAEQQRTQDRASHFRSLIVGVLTEDLGVIGVLSGAPGKKINLTSA